VFVAGELDLSSVGELASALDPVDGSLVIDLGGVSFMDSSGIRTLVVARKRLLNHGGSLLLRAPQPHVRLLLEITGLDAIIV
jgi:anti-anti-sigma factor